MRENKRAGENIKKQMNYANEWCKEVLVFRSYFVVHDDDDDDDDVIKIMRRRKVKENGKGDG